MLLLLAEVFLVILSWILSTMTADGVRSLLSSEGIRWFFGSYTALLASPFLVWLLLMLVAVGSFQASGVARQFGLRRHPFSYRERIAFRVAVGFLLLYLGIIALLTLVPHAILLSAAGELFPSAFSRSLVPVVAFGVSLFSVVYAVMAGRHGLSDILGLLTIGIQRGASLVILYVLLIQFYESLRFVFG